MMRLIDTSGYKRSTGRGGVAAPASPPISNEPVTPSALESSVPFRAGDACGESLPAHVHSTGRFDAVLFDLDRTLFHFDSSRLPEFVRRVVELGHAKLIEMGHTPPKLHRYANIMRFYVGVAFVRSFVFRREIPIVEVIKFSHARLQMPLTNEDAIELAWTCEAAMRERMTVDPESKPMLDKLRKSGLKLGLVSNTIAPHFLLDDYLHSVHLLDYLPMRVYSSEVTYRKPHREIFRQALSRLGACPSRTVFVGDRMRNDVKGAARMGMTTILVSPTGVVGRGSVKPDHVVRSLSEIPAIVGVNAS